MSNMNQNNNANQQITSMQSQVAAYTFDLASGALNTFASYFPDSAAKMQKTASDGIIEAIISGLKIMSRATGTFSTNGRDDLMSLLLIIAEEKNDKKIEDIIKVLYPEKINEFEQYMNMASDMRNKSLLATIAMFSVAQFISTAVLLPAVLSTAATIALSSPSIVNKEDFRTRLKQEFSTDDLSSEGKIKHFKNMTLLQLGYATANTLQATTEVAKNLTNGLSKFNSAAASTWQELNKVGEETVATGTNVVNEVKNTLYTTANILTQQFDDLQEKTKSASQQLHNVAKQTAAGAENIAQKTKHPLKNTAQTMEKNAPHVQQKSKNKDGLFNILKSAAANTSRELKNATLQTTDLAKNAVEGTKKTINQTVKTLEDLTRNKNKHKN